MCPPGLASSPPLAVPVPTFGVEEEFFLLNPDGSTAPVAPQVLGGLPQGRFEAEWMQCQIESITGVCTDLSELAGEMTTGRRTAAAAAAAQGTRMVASGTPPFQVPGPETLTDDDRFHRLRTGVPEGPDDVVACGFHVHVGVPTRALGVEVVNRVRGWLPVLLALSGNSPMWEGEDSGWESYRHHIFSRWPTARVAPLCPDVPSYDAALDARISAHEAVDARSVYWYARLSPRFPTVEFRIADTGLTVDDSLLQAALCRALVATALADAAAGVHVVDVPQRVLDDSLLNAAHQGLGTLLIDPWTGVLAPGSSVLQKLVEHLHPALRAAGDWTAVAQLITQRRTQRSGSFRQRTLRRDLDRKGFVQALASESLPQHQAAGPHRSSTVAPGGPDRGGRR